MSLPFQFANVTTLVTSQLDANYNALGALTPIPCSASGSNAITLTPLANTPTVSAYSNYMQFRGVAAQSNTTTATAAVGGLAALPIYKDTGGGPIALTGSEIIQNCQFDLIYDSALNSGSGGFHLEMGSVLTTAGGTITGTMVLLGPVQFGQTVSTFLTSAVSTAPSLSWPNVAATSATASTVILPGCSVGDCVIIGTPASIPVGVTFFGWVPASGSVSIQALNSTGSSLTPTAGTYRIVAQRYS